MFKLIKAKLAFMKRCFLAGMDAASGPFLISNEMIFGKHIFEYEAGVLTTTGSEAPNAIILKDGDIIINTAMALAPKHILEAVVAHEIGHQKLGHLKHSLRLNIVKRMFSTKAAIQKEIDADKFAITMVPKEHMIEAILFIYKNERKPKEYHARLDALRGNSFINTVLKTK